MKKISYIILTLALFLGIFGLAKSSEASSYTYICTGTNDQSAINSLISTVGNDTLTLSGNCTFNGPVYVTDLNTTIRGDGNCAVDSFGVPTSCPTTIAMTGATGGCTPIGQAGAFCMASTGANVVSGTSSAGTAVKKVSWRIHDLEITGANPAGEVIGINTTSSDDIIMGWRIDHIKTSISTYASNGVTLRWLITTGRTWGLLDHINADCGEIPIFMYPWNFTNTEGSQYQAWEGNTDWALSTNLGSDEATYLEDSLLTWPNGGYSFVTDAVGGAALVIRKDRINGGEVYGHTGESGTLGRGWRKFEIYQNIFAAPMTGTGYAPYGNQGEGTGVIFENQTTGYDRYFLDVQNTRPYANYFGKYYGVCLGATNTCGPAGAYTISGNPSASTSGGKTMINTINNISDSGSRGLAIDASTKDSVSVNLGSGDHTTSSIGFYYKTPASALASGEYTWVFWVGNSYATTVGAAIYDTGGSYPTMWLQGSAWSSTGIQLAYNTWYWVTAQIVKGGTSTLRVYTNDNLVTPVGSPLIVTATQLNPVSYTLASWSSTGQTISTNQYFDNFVINLSGVFPLGGGNIAADLWQTFETTASVLTNAALDPLDGYTFGPGGNQSCINTSTGISYDGNLETSGWPCLDQVGRGCTKSSCPLGTAQDSVPLLMWHNGPEATCTTQGGACTDNSSVRAGGTPTQYNSTPPTSYVSTSAHTNGDKDYCIIPGGISPNGYQCGNYINTYAPYTYPHPLQGGAPPLVLYGDVSGDNTVTAYDAALVAQAAVGLISFTTAQVQAGDVDGNGTITAYDAALIAQKVVGLINKFPVES